MAVAATSAAAQTADVNSAGRTRLAESFDTFLTLLTAQMKNQDPLSPLDSNQFTSQLVQMTGVEQQLRTNDLLKELVGNTASGVATAVSLIGKEVRAVADTTALNGGQAKWVYKLDRAASDVKLEILNDKGAVVDVRAATDNKAGEHAFTWDGKSTGGTKLPNGAYTLRVTAKDGSNTVVPSTVYVQGLVSGVEQADGKTLITINGGKVDWGRVTSITQPAPPSSTATQAQTASGVNPNPDDQTSSAAAA
jgi:flagellar basal-body rod modification protein FlgD